MFVQLRSDGAQRLVTSASDLTAASTCEFAFLRRVDAKLGRDVEVPPDDDPMLARAARLGDAHEERVLEVYRAELGRGVVGARGGVVEISRPESMSAAALEVVAAATEAALRGGAEVVFQATFFETAQRPADPSLDDLEIAFLGFADFLRRTEDDAYEVQDTKLARRAKVTALMQLAAYAEQLQRIGVPVSGQVTLILGDGARSVHRLADIAPVFRARRRRLHEILLARVRARGSDGRRESAPPVGWGEPHVVACGRCEVCEPEVIRARDPLLIAGIRMTQRNALIAAGFDTIDAVAALTAGVREYRPGFEGSVAYPTVDPPEAIPHLAPQSLARIAAQAAVQLEAMPGEKPPVRVVDPLALGAIPQPNVGDLFFDFEGDPMYREPGDDARARWGIDYLFGMVDLHEKFVPLWAHDLAAEKQALIDFLALVSERRRAHPGMRIYHYAAYERTHLLSIAARHGVGEAEIDQLLREHVLVDLYPIVRRALRIGSRSYSIKKLEPLYMGDELRDDSGVTNAAQSVTEYADASELLASDDPEVRAAGQRQLDAIADYNRYDCVSTLRLRDWLLRLAAEYGVAPYPPTAVAEDRSPTLELSTVAAALAMHAAVAPNDRDRTAAALASSAIDYHQREQKAFWWAHYARLIDPIEDWSETRDVMIIDEVLSGVLVDWFLPNRARSERRHVRLRGAIAPGSRLRVGGDAYLLYDIPVPFVQPGAAPGARGVRRVTIIDAFDDGVVVEELVGGSERYASLPVALVPGPPPPAGAQKGAIEEWGTRLVAALDRGELPRDPVIDLLRRDPPRLAGDHSGGGPDGRASGEPSGVSLVRADSKRAADMVDGDREGRMIGAVAASLLALDHSYLAVQGPPGTGKTYLAARVIRLLVERHGWRIGVVAQSHKVVENVLAGVIAAGLDPGLVGKVPQGGALDADDPDPGYTVLRKDGQAAFLLGHRQAARGCVLGGTAWDFSNRGRVERGELDLLVIDEAGQFSLAPTIAASVSAQRLLLLGDPQQLPQVSQGSHPEPVDTSALGWLLGEHDTMPEELGYFLAETRRMRPELAEVVSELAYDGRLRAHPDAADREVEGVGPPGLIWHQVEHYDNSTSSAEEAVEVARIARAALTARIREPGMPKRRLNADDVIVVAPYNAQVEVIAGALMDAGLNGIRVGTVDKFQGQEAAIAIVSLAASSADDVPRGLEFLLMRNRLNVAISRAQWAAHLVSSSRLGEGLPATAEGVAALSGYLRLTERGTVVLST